MSTEILFYFLAGTVVILGLVGVFLPMIPGVPLVLIGILIACVTAKFSFISTLAVVVLVVLALISIAIDYASGLLGAQYSGAGILGSIGALLGAVFGFSVLGPIGVIVGPALGVLIFELIAKRSIAKPAKSATYALMSTVAGILINFLIAIIMVTITIVSIFV